MPVSHIGLTVSQLSRSCSFFLEALQPLGYKYLGQQGNQIGFGSRDPDFFICQESHGNKAGAAHIAFSAPSRDAVDDFYDRAISAGAKSHGRPGVVDRKSGYYSAAVLDFDGNSIEVVYRPSSAQRAIENGNGMQYQQPRPSKVLTWQKDVATRSVASDTGSVVSNNSFVSLAAANPPAATTTTTTTTTTPASTGTSTTLIGTLIGVAAGAAAAAAYFENSKASETPAASVSHTLALENTPPTSQYNNAYALEQPTSYYAAPTTVVSSVASKRAIEAPPSRRHSGESYIWGGGDQRQQRSEVGSVAEPLRRSGSIHHNPNPHAAQPHYCSHVSEAPESIVSSFVVPGRQARQTQNEQRYHSSSKAPSTAISAEKYPLPYSSSGRSSISKSNTHRHNTHDDGDVSTILGPTRSVVASVLGRDTLDRPVAPSDSVSQVSSRHTSASSRHNPSTHSHHSHHHHRSTTSSHRSSPRRTSSPAPSTITPTKVSLAHRPAFSRSGKTNVSFAHKSTAARSSSSSISWLPIKKDRDRDLDEDKRSSAQSAAGRSFAVGPAGFTLYEERRNSE
ncbi:MAG: hypothetical protein M1839_000200 [Geoglossum umbratile]|nr:MAG: hypothetical protein M1839_000200 [Geoglossum umbratile]